MCLILLNPKPFQQRLKQALRYANRQSVMPNLFQHQFYKSKHHGYVPMWLIFNIKSQH